MKTPHVSEMRFFIGVLAIAFFFFVTRDAFAAPPAPASKSTSSDTPTPEAQAAQIKAQADAASDARHYDEAIDGYTRAYAIFPDPALLYNRSRAHEARGEYPEAYSDLDAFSNSASPELRKKIPHLTELLVQLGLKTASLELSCNISGARVLFAGREIGTTPLAPTRVNAGTGILEIVAEGEFPYKREITLKGGGPTQVDVTLSAKSSFGFLAVRTTPVGGVITVDGKPFGSSPTEGLLPAGTHSVLAHVDGDEDVSTRVVVEAGARREISLTLHSKKTILSSPYFWGAVGVVVVATVVIVTYAAVTEKSAGSGDGFAPGQVAGPLTW